MRIVCPLIIPIFTIISLLSYPSTTHASPFNQCPTEAFLIQDTVARIYGVNLATGYYEELSSAMGTNSKINAIGFNFHDDYLYGYGYEERTVVKIGADFIARPLIVSGLPDTSFYVGDVALNRNSYYIYRGGSAYGLYRIDLNQDSSNYLNTVRIVNGSQLNLSIFDFAFHPNNGQLYSVDRNGNLWQINPETGEAINLANVGQSGTFGAVYFDVSGYFYISRNSDGHIFRIDIGAPSPTAEFFAFGPSSGNNDGARCAVAPIVTAQSTIDFGDAPESYGTSIENNGARHELSEDLFLGELSGGSDDGVDFLTGFEIGLDTLINVKAEGNGYVNSWVDWDQNGAFDSDEQIVTDQQMQNGNNKVLIDVPDTAKEGSTWGRIRYSSTTGIGPTGGVSDGEVEDHQIVVTASGISIVSYPGNNSYVTLAYEDSWPRQGDYDMNDVVIAYRTRQYINEDERVVRYDIEGHLLASGAGYHNGFAVQLDNIASTNIDENLIRFKINNELKTGSPLENNGEQDAVVIIMNDVWLHVSPSGNCSYYRTQLGCEQEPRFSFLASLPLIDPINREDAPGDVLNPFIFATPGRYHGEGVGLHPGRSLEVHLKNKNISPRFNVQLFQRFDDNSDLEEGSLFVTDNNMPWAIELPTLWAHPYERIDVMDAYPEFVDFIQSEGNNSPTWYTLPKAMSDRVIINQE